MSDNALPDLQSACLLELLYLRWVHLQHMDLSLTLAYDPLYIHIPPSDTYEEYVQMHHDRPHPM